MNNGQNYDKKLHKKEYHEKIINIYYEINV